ncbi:MAG: DUF3472 domain-containing protein [Planctomycetaceae bacterium]
MTRNHSAFLMIPCIAAFCLASVGAGDPATRGQLAAPVTWIAVPGSADQFYLAQQTRDNTLLLTANEAFFPKPGLIASGSGKSPDIANLNGGKTFAAIDHWDAGDMAEWGLFLKSSGELTATIHLSANSIAGKFVLQIDDVSFPLQLQPSPDRSQSVATATVSIQNPGQHKIRLSCGKSVAGAALLNIRLAGAAVVDGAVLRKRWRPAAAHTKFSASDGPARVRLWVMEMDAMPGELDFYSPITTPFGYFGPTWRADGTVNSGLNFSLWSFGRGKPEPRVEQLSHLLAVGHPDAVLGGFDHEGTGVKIRNWEPLAGQQKQRQVLALRVSPGPVYDTYFSYFYSADEQRWRLFGVGNTFNGGKPLKSLWVGSFVEVPGPPHVQRTGPYPRTMRYRGWVMNDDGRWSVLDTMTGGNVDRDTGLTHTDRGLTSDGWFYLQTGGWTFRKPSSEDVKLKSPSPPASVSYLTPKDIAVLTTVPSDISITSATRVGDDIRGTFHIRNISDNAEAALYWGTSEGLTLADRWQHRQAVGNIGEGQNTFTISDVPQRQPILMRLLLKNREGQFWSGETIKVE